MEGNGGRRKREMTPWGRRRSGWAAAHSCAGVLGSASLRTDAVVHRRASPRVGSISVQNEGWGEGRRRRLWSACPGRDDRHDLASRHGLPRTRHSDTRRSTCRGRDDGHGLALRHGLPITESVPREAAAARQTAKPFQRIPATRMRCRPQRKCGDAHTACCVYMWYLLALPLGHGWVCVCRRAGSRGGGGGASWHAL